MEGHWEPQAPEVYDEAVAYLVADATRRHQEAHDASPPGCCRRCLDQEIRALVRAAKNKLSPDEFKHIRWAVRTELDT
jgi:hypothetical protein